MYCCSSVIIRAIDFAVLSWLVYISTTKQLQIAKMDKRWITQETFDAVVRENIEDFEMDDEAALTEAIEQFQSQGTRILT